MKFFLTAIVTSVLLPTGLLCGAELSTPTNTGTVWREVPSVPPVTTNVANISSRAHALYPGVSVLLSNRELRVVHKAEIKSVIMKDRFGKPTSWSRQREIPTDEGFILEVTRGPGPYKASLERGDSLKLAKQNARAEEGVFFATAALDDKDKENHVVVNVFFGEKCNLSQLKKMYEIVATNVPGMPQITD